MSTTVQRPAPAVPLWGSFHRVTKAPRGRPELLGQVVQAQGTTSRSDQHRFLTEDGPLILDLRRIEPYVVPAPGPVPPKDPLKKAQASWPDVFANNYRVVRPPKLFDLKGEVAAVRREYGEFGPVKVFFRRSSRTGTTSFGVSFHTAPVTLTDGPLSAPLGAFRVRIYLTLDYGRLSPKRQAVALTPVRSRRSRRLTHPHVNANYVCMGEAEQGFNAAMLEGRWSDAAFLINAVLHTYGKHTAYGGGKLENFVPQTYTCRNCQSVKTETPRYCVACGEHACEDCRGSACRVCGAFTHPACGGEAPDYCRYCTPIQGVLS